MIAPTKRREKEIQRAILDLLHARGVLAWKAGSGYVKIGHTGVSDIIGIMPPSGRAIACEVKMPGKSATLEQENFLASVRQAGGIAFVAHSVDEVAKELGWA